MFNFTFHHTTICFSLYYLKNEIFRMKRAKTFANIIKELHPPSTVDIFITVTSIPQIRGFLFKFETNNDVYEVIHLTVILEVVYNQHDAGIDLLNTAFVVVSPASSEVPEEFLMITNSLFSTLLKSILFILSASTPTRIFHQSQRKLIVQSLLGQQKCPV